MSQYPHGTVFLVKLRGSGGGTTHTTPAGNASLSLSSGDRQVLSGALPMAGGPQMAKPASVSFDAAELLARRFL